MTTPVAVDFTAEETADLAAVEGTVVVFVGADNALSTAGDHLDDLTGGALRRVIGSDGFKASAKKNHGIIWPAGMAAEKVLLASLGENPDREAARRAGGAIASALAKGPVTICTSGVGSADLISEVVYAIVLRLYNFDAYRKTTAKDEAARSIRVTSDNPEALATASAPFAALAEGVYFTRDLVNEPANVLNTDEFAARLAAMGEMGLEV
ncbi:MAG: M17 family peptidase N-terminal domain-containing protein, partial [Pseudomonadota bacterium]